MLRLTKGERHASYEVTQRNFAQCCYEEIGRIAPRSDPPSPLVGRRHLQPQLRRLCLEVWWWHLPADLEPQDLNLRLRNCLAAAIASRPGCVSRRFMAA